MGFAVQTKHSNDIKPSTACTYIKRRFLGDDIRHPLPYAAEAHEQNWRPRADGMRAGTPPPRPRVATAIIADASPVTH